MELSKTAREVLTQAQMLRMKHGGERLCVEHLFYGLLLLANYQDPPMNAPEHRAEGREVRGLLEGEMRSISSALEQLRQDAGQKNNYFEDAAPTLGRASELAGAGEITAPILARAVLEAQTPTVLALKGLTRPDMVQFDRRYHPEQKAPRVPPQPPKPEQPQPAGQKDSLSTSQVALLLGLLAAAHESQKEELVQHSRRRPGKQPGKPKRRTKMGPFTYPGGTVAAAVQYFLYGIGVPAAVLTVLQLTTHIFDKDLPRVPALLFALLGALWVFYLGRGLSLLFGIASSAFGNFLDILLDLGLIAAVNRAVTGIWGLPVSPAPLRVVSFIVGLLVLMVGVALYEHLRDEGDATKTKITFLNMQGSPGKLCFQSLTRKLMLPYLAFCGVWVFQVQPAGWMLKVFWIIGFFWAWSCLTTIYGCLYHRSNTPRHHRGRKLFKFLIALHVFWAISEFVVFLHWLFDWFPMRLPVMILLGMFTLMTFLCAVVFTASKDT